MSTRIGYVRKVGGKYESTQGWTSGLQEAHVITFSSSVPVRVTEEPGPPIREVVELRGTVDLDGLKFAIRHRDQFWLRVHEFGELDRALWYYSINNAAHCMASNGLDACEIVGIREVPGPTVRTVTEITE